MDKIILIGAGGNSKVVIDMLKGKYHLVGITDIDKTKHGKLFYDVKVLGNDDILKALYAQGVMKALVTLGSIGESSIRKKLFDLAKAIGFEIVNAVSSNAIVSESVTMGCGNIIMDHAIIHADTSISNNTIVNTGAILEHDCIIGHHVHIAPGANIAGGVSIGEETHIGIGASVIQGINIGKNCMIGAGAVVVDDIPDKSLAVGIPAKIIKQL